MSVFEEILQEVIGFVFKEVLQPILEEFLKFVVETLIDIIVDTFAWVFYYVMTTLFSIVSFLGGIFEFFSGTSKGAVIYNGQKYASVIFAFFSIDVVNKVFLAFTSVAIGLALILTIVRVIKSLSDMTLDNKNPITHVLKVAFKTAVSFAVIPLLCIFMLKLSQVVILTIDKSVSDATQSDATIDRILWYNASQKASSDPGAESYRKAVLNGAEPYKYADVDGYGKFEQYFEYKNFDLAQGIISGIFTVLILLITIIGFVRRLFELLVLYLVGPFFAATMPMDDGEMFKNWKDLFIAKFFSAFGSVLAMRVFLVICPILCSNRLVYDAKDAGFNSFMQLLFLIGGAYSVYMTQGLAMRLLNPEVAAQEEQNQGMAMRIVGKVGSMTLGTATAAVSGVVKGVSGGKGKDDKKDDGGGDDKGGGGDDKGGGDKFDGKKSE